MTNNLTTTNNNDIIHLAPDYNNINTSGGNDTVYGNIFADTIDGGAGDDVVYGNDGNDKLIGHTGMIHYMEAKETIVSTAITKAVATNMLVMIH